MNNAKHLKRTLLNLVDKLSYDHREFQDFTRNKKFPFHILIKFILCMEAGSIKDEL